MQAEKDGHAGATADNGPWLLGLDQPSYMAVMTYADNRYRAQFVVLPAYIQPVHLCRWNLTCTWSSKLTVSIGGMTRGPRGPAFADFMQ